MKCYFFILVCLVVVVTAEPPAYRSAKFGAKSAKQQVPPAAEVPADSSTSDSSDSSNSSDSSDTSDSAQSAPYAPSGWKPAGAKFELPSTKAEKPPTPAAEYLPAQIYGPPEPIYGPPATENDQSTTDSSESADDSLNDSSEESTTPPPASDDSGSSEEGELVESNPELQQLNQQGAYYILLPDSRLQKIIYSIQQDPEKMQYSSRLQSARTQTLNGPLIFYTPQFVQVV